MNIRAVNLAKPGGTPAKWYAFALAATLVALGAKLVLDRWVQNVSPFLFLTPVVMLSAWFGGFGPGLLATVAGALAADYFLLAPSLSFSRGESDPTRVVVFLVVGVQISWLSGALRKANTGLERRVRQRTAELDFQKTLLESQIEASKDGILAVSDAGVVIFSNRRFREIWGLDPAQSSGPLQQVRQAMRRTLADPSDVLADDAEADGDGPVIGDGSGQVVLGDGRVVERYSAPIAGADGASYGRVWFFRDVTERRRLEKEILQAGERERQSIGQDLHDDLCQQLTGIACLASVLRQRLTGRGADEAGDAGRILELVQGATACCRNVARGLLPVDLAGEGFVSALQGLCARSEQVFGVPCRFRVDAAGLSFPDASTPTHLYRVAQEAITNAVKHARATRICVDLVAAGGRLILSVEDDGVGIPPVLKGGGIGLHTMRHRAGLIGAALSVQRGTGGGTTVTCSLRVPEAPAAAEPAPPDGAAAGAAPPARAEPERAHA